MNQLATFISRTAALGLLLAGLAAPAAHAQADLLGQLEKETTKDAPATQVVDATFKSTRLINGHTVETPGEGTLVFLFSHNFGTINEGFSSLFGFDNASVRIALEYGLSDRLEVGLGRSSLDKTVDGFLKYRALRQSTGLHAMPVSVTLFTSAAVVTQSYADNFDRTLGLRTAYTYQALIARKFSPELSLQVMPTFIHRNLVQRAGENNDVMSLGAGGRYKLTKRFSVNAEYHYLLSRFTADRQANSAGVGVDIETGGHIFQLHISNSPGMIEKQFIAETDKTFFSGNLYYGFIVSRNFTVKQRHRK
jgi:opacity protein-like surface antigen